MLIYRSEGRGQHDRARTDRTGKGKAAADAVQLSQSAVSHQLRVLKDSKLVRFRREGKTVFYALDDDHVRSILSMGMDHIEE